MTDSLAVQPRFFADARRHFAIWKEAWAAEHRRFSPNLRQAERDFLPAAIEILEKPASPLGRATVWTLCALFTIVVAWSIVGRIDIVAVADGKVIPQGHTKVVQPFEIGVVRAIHVQDGDRVRVGQPLIDLDPTDASADHDRLWREHMARALDVARLDSLLGGGPVVRPMNIEDKVDPLLVGATSRLLQSQWDERAAKLAALDREIDQRAADIRVARIDIERLQTVLPLLRDRSDGLGGLASKGLTSRIHASEVLQQLIEAEKNLLAAQDKLQQAEASLHGAEQKRQQAEYEYENNWRKDRAEALDKQAATEQDMIKTRKRRDLQQLLSPIDGTVANLAAWTVGGVVKPADTLLNVVPLSATPEIEAQVLNKDIGFIVPGQKVSVKFEAFPFTRYGTVAGEVVDISRDANKDDKLGLIYPVTIRLESAGINVDGNNVTIGPGMSVSAEIITGNRRVIDFVLGPVRRYQHEAARER